MQGKFRPEDIERLFPVQKVEQYRNGVCKVVRKNKYELGGDRVVRGDRGEIEYLSSRARSHLAFVVSATAIQFNSAITLTYPEIYPLDGQMVKAHLNSMLTWLRLSYPNFSYVWVLEFQKRGAPHVHILTNLYEPQEWGRKEFAYQWAKISSPKNWAKELYPGKDFVKIRTDVFNVHKHKKAWEAIRHPGGAVKYIVKYALKTSQKSVPQAYRNVGRFYGWSRDVKDSIEAVATIELSDEGLRLVLDTMRHRTSRWDLPPKYIFGLVLVEEDDETNVSRET